MSALRLAPARPRLAGWRLHLASLAGVAALILLVLARDVADMVAIWWTSSTFGHCLFIPPILAWLVWQRRDGLRRLSPRASGWGLPLMATGGLGWLTGMAAGIAIARHAGLVLLLDGAVVALLGLAVARALVFPLAYAFFLVPAGEELVPPLQTLTANMCMALLALFRIPARIEGVFITTQSGWFEVAEACSGVKFLVAMVALGVLAAHIGFVSWRRRAAFLAVCLAVPILANGVRAFSTIYAAHLTSAARATSFDHVVYGWFFFAAVIVLVLAASWRFFDRGVDAPWFDPARLQVPGTPAGDPRRLAIVTAAAVLLALAPAVWSRAVAAPPPAALPPLALPPVVGWTRAPIAGAPWRPRFRGADQYLIGRYADRHGRSVDVAVALYMTQGEGREVVGYGQGAVDPDSGWAWSSDRPAPANGAAIAITAPGGVVREALTFYRLAGMTTGSEVEVKLLTLKSHLTGGDPRALALVLSAEARQGGRAAIDGFLGSIGTPARFLAAVTETR